ncbi:60s ribosomal l30 [Tubulinosema ratisbonensis]|uniref:60s ribosomal l30 n=1 Tax=Tubulinosema ratisbonensis TaxID=291195 RepID=A0A437AQK6_9MICR|nr:60s ribosomal l30 [Tubulinosema ratisbonensis]
MSRKKQVLEGLAFKLPLAMKTGKYVIGYKQALKLLRNNETRCLIIASNFPSVLRKKLEYYAFLLKNKPVTIYSGNNNELAKLCEMKHRIGVISILNEGEADLLGLQN